MYFREYILYPVLNKNNENGITIKLSVISFTEAVMLSLYKKKKKKKNTEKTLKNIQIL